MSTENFKVYVLQKCVPQFVSQLHNADTKMADLRTKGDLSCLNDPNPLQYTLQKWDILCNHPLVGAGHLTGALLHLKGVIRSRPIDWCSLTHWGMNKMTIILQMTFYMQLVEWKSVFSINISLKFAPVVSIDNMSTLVQVMVWSQRGDKPLPDPMLIHIYVAIRRHQTRVNSQIVTI